MSLARGSSLRTVPPKELFQESGYNQHRKLARVPALWNTARYIAVTAIHPLIRDTCIDRYRLAGVDAKSVRHVPHNVSLLKRQITRLTNLMVCWIAIAHHRLRFNTMRSSVCVALTTAPVVSPRIKEILSRLSSSLLFTYSPIHSLRIS